MSDWQANMKRKVNAILKKNDMKDSSMRTDTSASIVEAFEDVLDEHTKEAIESAFQGKAEIGVELHERWDVEVDGQTFRVPYIVFFSAKDGNPAGYYFLEVVAYRKPEPGDCYIEGHMTESFVASRSVFGEHIIVKRTFPAKKHNVWREDVDKKESKQEG